ncbi:MAG: XRE family transcriptional regulator [Reyranella sp.]|nr:XRE family transcriptional regulator [Reyranella sp.]
MDKVARATHEIGQRLRGARNGAGRTLAEVAAKAGVSEGFLSKLERGQAAASIANLIQLTDALGLGLHELFAGPNTPARTRVAVHRAGHDAAGEVVASGYRWRPLGGGAPLDRLEVFHLTFPREKGMEAMVSHAGQEHCYVLSGEVLFFVGAEQFRLKAGDGIFIDSSQPHRAENAGRSKAQVLMTVTKSAEASDAPDWWQLSSGTLEKETAR